MSRKLKLLLLLFSLSTTVFLMNHTYSRYVATSTNNIEAGFAKWQILINNEDITAQSNSTIEFSPVIDESEFVREGKIAPSSKGYFDIEIDATNSDVAFNYKINLEVLNEDLPDFIISKYAIIASDYNYEDPLDLITINDKTISGDISVAELDSIFTIRIYFEWINDEFKTMTDEEQTSIGILAIDDYELNIEANISFEQIFN